MRYEVVSSKTGFAGDALKGYFSLLSEVCERHNTSYFVVGAFVRDLILEQIYEDRGGVETHDIDVAIYLENWEQYAAIVKELCESHGFKRMPNAAHAYITPAGIQTDIVPYGLIEDNRRVSFPDSPGKAMNMLGFREVIEHAHDVIIDKEVAIKIPPIEGIILIKLFAWNDRKGGRWAGKHITDIGLLIDGYFDANLDAIYSHSLQPEVEAEMEEEFLHQGMSAGIIASKLKPIVDGSPQLKQELRLILNEVAQGGDNHPVIVGLAQVFKSSVTEAQTVFDIFKKFLG